MIDSFSPLGLLRDLIATELESIQRMIYPPSENPEAAREARPRASETPDPAGRDLGEEKAAAEDLGAGEGADCEAQAPRPPSEIVIHVNHFGQFEGFQSRGPLKVLIQQHD